MSRKNIIQTSDILSLQNIWIGSEKDPMGCLPAVAGDFVTSSIRSIMMLCGMWYVVYGRLFFSVRVGTCPLMRSQTDSPGVSPSACVAKMVWGLVPATILPALP